MLLLRSYHCIDGGCWRQTIARALRKPPYRIVPNATLNALTLRRPTTLEELRLLAYQRPLWFLRQ